MQSYLQPDALTAAGLPAFDGWAATFGRTVTAIELSPDGSSYRMHSRFARFANVPELLTMFGAVADIAGRDQVPLDVPDIAGGGPETVIVTPGDELREFMAELVTRAQAVRNRTVRPEDDNMLAIGNDGRAAALDLRLVGRPPDGDVGKVAVAAGRVAQLWEQTRFRRYLAPDGTPSARPGTLQLVFCDLGTPKKGAEWSVYEELRRRLYDGGIPHGQVRFIHDAANDKAKGELFAACRDGRVSVLIGSTDKMGVGVNVQTRAVAVHHLDCPWWPASIEQRDGRIRRQGNQNPEVHVLRYATQSSFDVFTWQTVQRKATFIDQVMRGDIAGRSVDDIGDAALSYAEVKALATGNPLIMERAGVASDLVRLERQLAAHNRDQAALVRTHASAERRASHARASADAYRAVNARRQPTAGDHFSMTVAGTRHDKRADAATALKEELTGRLDRLALGARSTAIVGQLGGIDVGLTATRDPGGAYGELGFSGLPGWVANFTRGELRALAPIGLISRLEHRLNGLAERAAEADDDADRAEAEAARASGRIGADFDQMARIEELRSRLADIDAELAPLEETDPPPTEPAGSRAVAYQDLPTDTRARIADLTGRHDLHGSSFEVFPVEVSRFPDVPIGDDPGDSRTQADYHEVAPSVSTQALLLGEYWLAGRRLVAAARAKNVSTIDAIDLTAVVAGHDPAALRGGNLGRLTRSTAQHLADPTMPAAEAPPGYAGDAAYAVAPGIGMPRWPKRQTRERSHGKDIGL